MKKLSKQAQKIKDLAGWLVKNKPLYTSWCECSFCAFYRAERTKLEEMTNNKK